MRACLFPILLLALLALIGCSDGSSDGPASNAAHPKRWVTKHDAEANASPSYTACTVCHGAALEGGGGVVSCYLCHTFDSAPPFVVHPSDWTDPYADHRAYAALNGYSECNGCHGPGLRGSDFAPGCYSPSYEGQSCHADGPVEVPHALDGSFLDPAAHGRVAKTSLTACQDCHGEAGGPGDNPRFNVGIFSASGTGCESADCHGVGYAHPTAWAGPNDTFHYSAESVQAACTLCHGENLDGVGGVGWSCLGCHASVATFSLDCTFCHGYPPQGEPDVATGTGVDHLGVAEVQDHVECFMCHGMYQTAGGGGFNPASRYILFDKSTDTLGDHWNGKITMSAEVGYDPQTFGCTACHGNIEGRRLSDSGVPVDLKPVFEGN